MGTDYLSRSMLGGRGFNVDDKLAGVLDAHAYMVCKYYRGKASLAKNKGIHAKSIARIKEIMRQEPKEYVYAIGYSDGRGGFGMTNGPSLYLHEMLDVYPLEDAPAFIFRFDKGVFNFNNKVEHKHIFRWHKGRRKWLPI